MSRLEEIKNTKYFFIDFGDSQLHKDWVWLINRAEELERDNNRLKNLVNDTEIEYDSLEKSTESAYRELEDLRRGDLNKLGELADVINGLREENQRYKQFISDFANDDDNLDDLIWYQGEANRILKG